MIWLADSLTVIGKVGQWFISTRIGGSRFPLLYYKIPSATSKFFHCSCYSFPLICLFVSTASLFVSTDRYMFPLLVLGRHTWSWFNIRLMGYSKATVECYYGVLFILMHVLDNDLLCFSTSWDGAWNTYNTFHAMEIYNVYLFHLIISSWVGVVNCFLLYFVGDSLYK